jgi:hypothetical protein
VVPEMRQASESIIIARSNVGLEYCDVRLLFKNVPLVYSTTLKEAMSNHALREQKKATTKTSKSRNLPISNQGDFGPEGT